MQRSIEMSDRLTLDGLLGQGRRHGHGPRGDRDRQTILFKITLAVLAITGTAQMPIFKRYYIADIPGLGWTADFYLTHWMHYVAAAVLLFLISYRAATYLGAQRQSMQISFTGHVRIFLYGVIVATGLLRVLKNLPDVSFSPVAVMLIDWVHLGMAPALGLFSLAAMLTGRAAYLKARGLRQG